MDVSGAPVTDELTGVHRGPQRDAIYEPEKTARHKARPRQRTQRRRLHLHNFFGLGGSGGGVGEGCVSADAEARACNPTVEPTASPS